MKVELYLESMDQDFSAATLECLLADGQGGVLEPSNWANWGNWGNWNNWTNWTNWSNFGSAVPSAEVDGDIGQLRIRREAFGGIVLDPSTQRVFKADDEAMQALQLPHAGETSEVVACEIGVEVEAVDRVITQLFGGGGRSAE